MSRHDWKIVEWDLKAQPKQTILLDLSEYKQITVIVQVMFHLDFATSCYGQVLLSSFVTTDLHLTG